MPPLRTVRAALTAHRSPPVEGLLLFDSSERHSRVHRLSFGPTSGWLASPFDPWEFAGIADSLYHQDRSDFNRLLCPLQAKRWVLPNLCYHTGRNLPATGNPMFPLVQRGESVKIAENSRDVDRGVVEVFWIDFCMGEWVLVGS